MPTTVIGYAALSAKAPLQEFHFSRRDLNPDDVQIDILYCGVCHSDLHTARNEWKGSTFPVVPGHEIIGRVIDLGKKVTRFAIGDIVAVGCMINSCQTCTNCMHHLEQFCDHGPTYTYNSPEAGTSHMTYGGYSTKIVVRELFVLQVPKKFQQLGLAATAPLLCAGITTYSPLKHWNIQPGHVVGVIGLGGLGHMAIKIAKAMKAHVVVFTSSPNKVPDAYKLGADDVVISKNKEELLRYRCKINFIIDTVSMPHDLNLYLEMLKTDGSLCLIGLPEELHPPINISELIMKRRSLAGSLIGGLQETQEMLEFCSEHNIVSDIELIPIQSINSAYDRLLKGQVRYRFVIDMASLKK